MDDVNWRAPAELRRIGIDEVVRGTLAECVRAYQALPDAERSGAMVICDGLVPLADGRPAAKSIEGDDLAWLAGRLPDDGEDGQ